MRASRLLRKSERSERHMVYAEFLRSWTISKVEGVTVALYHERTAKSLSAQSDVACAGEPST